MHQFITVARGQLWLVHAVKFDHSEIYCWEHESV